MPYKALCHLHSSSAPLHPINLTLPCLLTLLQALWLLDFLQSPHTYPCLRAFVLTLCSAWDDFPLLILPQTTFSVRPSLTSLLEAAATHRYHPLPSSHFPRTLPTRIP